MYDSEKIKCPIYTVWIVFILNIYFTNQYILESVADIFGTYIFLFLLLISIISIDLIASILVTLSFEKKKYCFYLTGLIMVSIFNLLMTIAILMYGGNEKRSEKISYALLFTAQISMLWSQTIILYIYNKRVKSSFEKHSYLNTNLINELPK